MCTISVPPVHSSPTKNRGVDKTTGGPHLVQFLGPGKNRAVQNSYYWVLHSQFPLVRILLHINSTDFILIVLKFVLVETVLVGDPM